MNRLILQRAGLMLALLWILTSQAGTAMAQPGTARGWGNNLNGQLGNGTTTSSYIPTAVSGLPAVSAVSAGGAHGLALKTDGTVVSWGYNYYGQLGNATNISTTTPVNVSGLAGIVAVAGGSFHSLALKADGTVWTWGSNLHGELGNGTYIPRNTPMKVSGLSGIVAIAARGHHNLAIENYSCGVFDPGFAEHAGEQEQQAGDFSSILSNQAEHAFPGLFTCSRVWAWGEGGSGQNGNGSYAHSTIPVLVSGLQGVLAIAPGYAHSLALKSDGTVWAWGSGGYGVLGNGTYTKTSIPVQVLGIWNATAIAAGNMHSMALRSDGTLSSWGDNTYGQLGNGTFIGSSTPVTSWLFPPIAAISAGSVFSLGLKSDGKVFAWGWNCCGQLGNATAGSESSIPVPVTNLTGVARISGGDAHALAITQPLGGVNPTNLSFGSVATGSSSASLNATLTNFGPEPMIVNSVAITGANAGDFNVTPPMTQPVTLPAYASMTVAVRFTPSANGARSATVLFLDNGFRAPHSLSLSGSGYTPNPPADLAVRQRVVADGYRLTYTIDVQNNGPGSATNVIFRDMVPDNTRLVSITAPRCIPNVRLEPVSCIFPELPSGSQSLITLVVDVIVDEPVQISNTASVASATPDPDASNNSSTLVTYWAVKQ